jgi:3-deoxy-D-manno-octulosonic-acid transferase
LAEIRSLFPQAILFSQLSGGMKGNVLIIDNIGMLSRLYRYAYVSYVGGGMTTNGVHNVLEAAVYGKPVVIGPYYEKYTEAVGLVNSGGAWVIKDENELRVCIQDLLANKSGLYDRSSGASKEFVWKNKGATDRIIQFIQENRLLTS